MPGSEIAYITRACQIDGLVVRENQTIESDLVLGGSPSVAAAKPGDLTTRTNDTDGTLTMDTGHGFATSDVIDLYWDGGSRIGVVVGTVATNSVPISGGTGDNLPVNNTAITAMKRNIHSESIAFAGNDLRVISISSPVPCVVHLVASDGTTYHASLRIVADDAVPAQYSYLWDNLSGVPNPVAGDAVGQIHITHGSESAKTIRLKFHKN